MGTWRNGLANMFSDMASAITNIHFSIDQAIAGIDDKDLTKAPANMGLSCVLNATQAETVAAHMQIRKWS